MGRPIGMCLVRPNHPVLLPSWSHTAVVAAARLVVVALSLAGIMTMHGLSLADVGGVHQSPVLLSSEPSAIHGGAVADPHAPSDSTAVAVVRQDLLDDSFLWFEPAADRFGHSDMASCVAILLGLIALALLGLRLLGRSDGGPSAWACRALAAPAARAPPQPIFLSLCVFRN